MSPSHAIWDNNDHRGLICILQPRHDPEQLNIIDCLRWHKSPSNSKSPSRRLQNGALHCRCSRSRRWCSASWRLRASIPPGWKAPATASTPRYGVTCSEQLMWRCNIGARLGDNHVLRMLHRQHMGIPCRSQ